MKPLVCLFVLALAACSETENPGVCCTTDEDCDRLGGILPRGCPDGQVCRNLRCEAADCAASTDCSAEQPVCDLASASCTGCTASADCDGHAGAPVCDTATGGCRACAQDGECASEVCDIDTGRCVAETEIIYASPSGAATAGCTHQQPCSVSRAIEVATADPSSSLVRLLPGTYGTSVVFTQGVVEVVGTGATIMTGYAVETRDAAVVEIRGFEILGDVVSMSVDSLFPSLTVRDSTIRGGTAFAVHGILRMRRSSIVQGQFFNNPVSVQNDGTFEADQTRFEGPPGTPHAQVRTLGHRMRVRITNSIFERISILLASNDAAPDKSEYHVSFSTFIFDTAVQSCGNPNNYPRLAVFENNIFLGPSVQRVIEGTACTLAGNITHPQEPDLGGTNIDQDPRFVSLQGKDYRLQPGSPGIDAAVLTSGPDLDHDFAGTPRPQGARKDIGAFEIRP